MAIPSIPPSPPAKTLVGATSVLDGAKGLVPKPVAGDESKVLYGSGLWNTVQAPADTIEVVNSSSSIGAWGTLALIGSTPLTSNITIALPQANSSIGKTVTFKRMDSTAFTVTLLPFAGDTVEVTTPQSLNSQYGSLTMEATGVTASAQVASVYPGANVLAEAGESVSIGNNQAISQPTFGDVTGGSFTLPSAGTWEVTYNVFSAHANAGAFNSFRLVDSANAQVANSEAVTVSSFANNAVAFETTQTVRITTTGSTVYKLQAGSSSTGAVIYNNAFTSGNVGVAVYGRSKIVWKKISGYVPVLGNSVEKLYAYRTISTSTMPADNTAYTFNVVEGEISNTVATNGRVVLKAGKTYELTGNIVVTNTVASGFTSRWYNVTTGQYIGNLGRTVQSQATNGESGGGLAYAIVAAGGVDTTVELRIVSGGGTTGVYGGFGSPTYGDSWIKVTQIGAAATTILGGSTALLDGAAGYVPQPLAGQQTRVLRGDGTWAVPTVALNGVTDSTANGTSAHTTFPQVWGWTNPATSPLTLNATTLNAAVGVLSLNPPSGGTALQTSGRIVTDVGTTTAQTNVSAAGSINDYFENRVKNNNAVGTAAQSGFTAEGDFGTGTTGFAWLGINNTAFNNPQLYNAGVAQDVTLLGAGRELIIANANQTQAIKFQTGTAISPFFTTRMTILNNGNVGINTVSPASHLDVSGSIAYAVTSTAVAAYTVLATDTLVDLTLAGAQAVTLPAAASFPRRMIKIRNATATVKSFAVGYTNIFGATSTVIPERSVVCLQSNGAAWLEVMNTDRTMNVQRFTASGTYTPTVGMRSVIVELIGGGAGGSPSIIAAISQVSVGGGGGNGGYVSAMLTAAQVGASVAVTIGAGGAAATAGGATTFGALLSGGGGAVAAAAATSGVVRADVGGVGGTATVTTGTQLAANVGGQSTAYGLMTGTTYLGVRTPQNSLFGAGALPQTQSGTTAFSSAGNAAPANTGCGGNGGFSAGGTAATGAAAAGGAGGSGYLCVTEYF
jgi:hypothetical protein